MVQSETFVIVGAGLAGSRAAEALREHAPRSRVVLIGDEPERPYDRVTLSKHFLHRATGFHGLYLHEEGHFRDIGVDLRLGTPAVAIDTGHREVVLGSGERLGYDAALVATGARPRRHEGPGGDLEGVFTLRTLADATNLRAALESAAGRQGRVVVVGSGWIGCEVAAAARGLGLTVDLVGRQSLPLERQVGTEMAAFFRDLHVRHGVTLRAGVEVTAFEGRERVERAVLSDGTTLPADVVVLGIGATPRTELAGTAGAAVDNGIVTDEFFRTGVPGVFAAGDCASALNLALGRHHRLEHYSAAFAQGPWAARAMLGKAKPYAQIPFFFSDQYDMWMEFTGQRAEGDSLVVRTLPGPETFIAFWLREGRVVGGMNINVKGVPAQVRALITSGRTVDPQALADPEVPLVDLAA